MCLRLHNGRDLFWKEESTWFSGSLAQRLHSRISVLWNEEGTIDTRISAHLQIIDPS